jgi:DNA invertase Pin-like site-specific DNA recombinase
LRYLHFCIALTETSDTIKRKMPEAIPKPVQIAAARRLVVESRFPAPPSYVAYYRVSTDRQGDSGLGLDAQREAVARYVGEAPIVSEFQEIESGRKKNRPALTAALEACRKHRAVLVIAKLDRLARNVHFISGLMESKVEFACADNPHVHTRDHHGRFILHQLAVMAEWEAGAISQRTREALHQVQRQLADKGQRTSVRGRVFTRLGNPRWQEGSLARARAARNPTPIADQVIAMMAERRAQGKTYRQIAAELNAMGIKARRGGIWHDTTVRKAIAKQ